MCAFDPTVGPGDLPGPYEDLSPKARELMTMLDKRDDGKLGVAGLPEKRAALEIDHEGLATLTIQTDSGASFSGTLYRPSPPLNPNPAQVDVERDWFRSMDCRWERE